TFQVSQRNLLDYFRRRAEDPGKNTHVNVRIKLPNGTIYPHAGVSDLLDVLVDPTTDTVTVRATVPNPDHVLLTGGVGGVHVERGYPKSALTARQAAVWLERAGRYGLVVGACRKVEQGRVTTGAEQGRSIVVTKASRRASKSSSRASRRCVP